MQQQRHDQDGCIIKKGRINLMAELSRLKIFRGRCGSLRFLLDKDTRAFINASVELTEKKSFGKIILYCLVKHCKNPNQKITILYDKLYNTCSKFFYSLWWLYEKV